MVDNLQPQPLQLTPRACMGKPLREPAIMWGSLPDVVERTSHRCYRERSDHHVIVNLDMIESSIPNQPRQNNFFTGWNSIRSALPEGCVGATYNMLALPAAASAKSLLFIVQLLSTWPNAITASQQWWYQCRQSWPYIPLSCLTTSVTLRRSYDNVSHLQGT